MTHNHVQPWPTVALATTFSPGPNLHRTPHPDPNVSGAKRVQFAFPPSGQSVVQVGVRSEPCELSPNPRPRTRTEGQGS